MKKGIAVWTPGPISVAVYFLGSAVFKQLQSNWQPALLNSGKLGFWWLITAGYVFLQALIVVAVFFLIFRRHLSQIFSPGMRPVLTSLSLDLIVMLTFWSLSAIFADPILESPVEAAGLRYFPAILFIIGLIWFFSGFLRVKIFSKYAPFLSSQPRT